MAKRSQEQGCSILTPPVEYELPRSAPRYKRVVTFLVSFVYLRIHVHHDCNLGLRPWLEACECDAG